MPGDAGSSELAVAGLWALECAGVRARNGLSSGVRSCAAPRPNDVLPGTWFMRPASKFVGPSSLALLAAALVSLGELIPINRDWAAVELTYLEALREVMAAWTELRALAGDI